MAGEQKDRQAGGTTGGMDTILEAGFDPARFAERPLPPRAGVGLKGEHVADILKTHPDIGFFEVHAENYMGGGGLPHAQLAAIRALYPLSVHGVGMSIGGSRPIDREHLARFAAVIKAYNPAMVSEHLAWSTHDDIFYNDLLPLPYTSQTLRQVVEHIEQVQEAIGRSILIENPSTYVTFAESTWSETDFLDEIAARSGCGLLLDVNNIFVSAANHGFSPSAYVEAFPLHRVGEIHLAGHAADTDADGDLLLIDAHDRQVSNGVWDLFSLVISRTGPLPSLVEWDNDVPDWPQLLAEAQKADARLGSNRGVSHGRN